MITKENKLEKICSFYASDYHLEMIMIPYINKKIEEKANVIIVTERNLRETAKTVISRINIPEARKREILSINWDNNNVEGVKKTNGNQEEVVFVIGNINYINKVNENIEELYENYKTKVINCFSIDEVQEKMTDIVSKHTKVLNTTEEKEIN